MRLARMRVSEFRGFSGFLGGFRASRGFRVEG